MEYGKIISRSARIVWQNKFLIILGIIASLSTSTYSGGGGGGGGGSDQPLGNIEQYSDVQEFFTGLTAAAIIGFVCLALFIGILLWVVSTVARGGIIGSVDAIEDGGKSGFTQAWSAGWRRVKTLLGIGIIPAIPGLILFIIGFVAISAYGGFYALFGDGLYEEWGAAGLGVSLALLACILVPVMVILSILRNFAERACMLEGLGVVESYRRGTSVLTGNLGEVLILFILQVAIFFGLFLLFVPGLILMLCCCLWPLMFVIQGAVTAFLTALWTLAYRHWIGEPPLVEKAPAAY